MTNFVLFIPFYQKGACAYEGPVEDSRRADVIITTSDDAFYEMANGTLNNQKAFTSGKLKVKGSITLESSEYRGTRSAKRSG